MLRGLASPYRKPQPLAGDAPRRLECWLRDGDKNRWMRAVYVKLWITLVACVMLAQSNARVAAIPVALIGALWAWSDFRARHGSRIVFSVRGGRVHIERAERALDFALEDLSDVRLDTKSTSKNLTVARADGVNSVFGAPSAHSIEVDVSRVELIVEGEEDPILLEREFISGSLCAEELRSIRLFLRAHGWKPLDERHEKQPGA